MKVFAPILAIILLHFAGCANHHVQSAPSLTGPAVDNAIAPPTQPRSPGLLERAANTTWNVVSTPARMVLPPERKPAREPEVYQAPQAFILDPNANEVPPAPTTAPSTQP